MKADLVDEHRWLQQLTGRWRLTFNPSQESGEMDGGASWEETARLLGDAWIVAEATGTMPDGSAATNILALGYDPARKLYVGSFISSVMTNLWIYEGKLDETGKVLTLDCEGPDFDNPGQTARYQDIITIRDADSRNFSSRIRRADGTWKSVMSCDYNRI